VSNPEKDNTDFNPTLKEPKEIIEVPFTIIPWKPDMPPVPADWNDYKESFFQDWVKQGRPGIIAESHGFDPIADRYHVNAVLNILDKEDRVRDLLSGKPKELQKFINRLKSTYPENIAVVSVVLLRDSEHSTEQFDIQQPFSVAKVTAVINEKKRAFAAFIGAIVVERAEGENDDAIIYLIPVTPYCLDLLKEAEEDLYQRLLQSKSA
jgi:hypothetical protein